MAKKTFEIDMDIVRGVALLFDLELNDVGSEEIECALLKELEHVRDNYAAKSRVLQEVISTQYIPYNSEKETDEVK